MLKGHQILSEKVLIVILNVGFLLFLAPVKYIWVFFVVL